MSPITKSMTSHPVALELPGMVGSFAYPAPAKQSLPPKATSHNLLISLLPPNRMDENCMSSYCPLPSLTRCMTIGMYSFLFSSSFILVASSRADLLLRPK
ncbi:hypothetical protein FIBSPDRAFT_117186 [Athelia psychrophila]|uniref:Uncharacterized protein n=1 Tax=Athelia psychrophila TaxID=1759441 RepID=A0A166CXD3_9AGAM|nr:hypothetical protein FIBSPDRAFT_117186 [Fibularhizoctonia sp. CBS 109695]